MISEPLSIGLASITTGIVSSETANATVAGAQTASVPLDVYIPPANGALSRVDLSHSMLAKLHSGWTLQQKAFVAKHFSSPFFRKTLLSLTYKVHREKISADQLSHVVHQAMVWGKLLTDRYEGSDLIDKAFHFCWPNLGQNNSKSTFYEVEVARLILENPDVVEVLPVPPGNTPTPDYRITAVNPDGSRRVFFAEVKMVASKKTDSPAIRHALMERYTELLSQLNRYPESVGIAENRAYMALILPEVRNQKQQREVERICRRWAENRIKLGDPVGMIHLDIYTSSLRKVLTIEVSKEDIA
ncbi:MAG: hypothetical protein Q7T03_00105 [Deltaproteobacteria bacterium]|nr:hypothetical protein [Deltaproteobacteria bacterium]